MKSYYCEVIKIQGVYKVNALRGVDTPMLMSTRNLKQLKLQQFFFLEYILVEV